MSLLRRTITTPSARAKKRDTLFLRVAETFLLIGLLWHVSAWFFARDMFRISAISVVGNHAVSRDGLTAIAQSAVRSPLLWQISRENIFLYPKLEIVRQLYASDQRIADVSVSTGVSHVMEVNITEREPSLLWCGLANGNDTPSGTGVEGCYLADKQGYIFAVAPRYSGSPFLRIYGTPTTTPSGKYQKKDTVYPLGMTILPLPELIRVQEFTSLLRTIPARTVAVVALGEGDYLSITDHGWDVTWGSGLDATTTLKHLRQALQALPDDAQLREIDLRFSHKVFYRERSFEVDIPDSPSTDVPQPAVDQPDESVVPPETLESTDTPPATE